MKNNHYKSFRIHVTQTFYPEDDVRQVKFCTYLLNKLEQHPDHLNNIIFTDKFTNYRMLNQHNEHAWSIKNLHQHQARHPQIRFALKVWVGILGDKILGPYFYEETLLADRYLEFLNTFIVDYLNRLNDNICLARLNNL